MATKRSASVYVTGWCGGIEEYKEHEKCPYETTQPGLVCGCSCHNVIDS